MKMTRITAILSLCLVGSLRADSLAEVHAKVDALMKAEHGEEAAALLEKALKEHPDDVPTATKLGLIYTTVLKHPEKGAPLLEKGAKMGDRKSLRGLAVAQIYLQDYAGMLAYKKQYIDNYEKLNESRVVCFQIAGMEKDGSLFNELLRRTPEADLGKDVGLSVMIARAAKELVENDQVDAARAGKAKIAPESKPEDEGKPQPDAEPAPR